MKLYEIDSRMLNVLRQNRAAWTAYCDKVLAEACDITKLDEKDFLAAKALAVTVRKYFIDPIRLSEPVEPGKEIGKNEPEDYG